MTAGGAQDARPLLAASLACFRNGEVLIARRGKAPNRGLWSLPGGSVEFGENAADAAVREFREETGAEAAVVGLADVVELIGADENGGPARHAVILAYAGLWLSGEPSPSDEAEAFAWVAPDALGAFDGTPDLERVVRLAARIAS